MAFRRGDPGAGVKLRILGNLLVSRAVPDFTEAVAFDLLDEKIAVDGHQGIDFRTTGFEGVSGPDVADAGKVVGLRRFQQDPIAPTGWSDGGGMAVFIWDRAVIEKGRHVRAAFPGNGFHPDFLIG